MSDVGVSVVVAVEEPEMDATALSNDVKETTKAPSKSPKDMPYATQTKCQKYPFSFENLIIYVVPGKA
jgi:hypothetical protein